MKFVSSQLAFFLQNRPAQRNLRLLRRFLLFLLGLVILYSVLFHVLMVAEGQQHSWITGLYWTLTVMSTLGFGDIVFDGDVGRLFSVIVLASGVLFLLVVLPFTFIQFFYAPWLESQSRLRAPREVPEDTKGHVIVTHYDPVAISLIERLKYHGRSYVVLEPDFARALELSDEGVKVMVGERDNLDSYVRLRAERSAMVVANGDDLLNVNIAFTVRALTAHIPVVAVARAPESIDIMELAGSTQVVHLPEMLGRSLARRTMGGDARANVIGRFGELVIAEAPVIGTPLVGKAILGSRLREATGLTVVGLWERGRFQLPRPDTIIEATTVLVLAGSEEQLSRFSDLTVIYNQPESPVLILGGGRVGRAAAHALAVREVPYRIVEQDPSRIRDPATYVQGSAADIDVLETAGIREAPTTIVTTNDDATNIYLTIYCRKLRPEMQIVSRATLERNVNTLHRAGADFVMSYASMGANAIYNVLEHNDVVMLAEGLDVFRQPVPKRLVGKMLSESKIRETTGCSVVALEHLGEVVINPAPDKPLPATAELILIGTTQGERQFVELYTGMDGRGRNKTKV
jgi:Trk K+ transport system NAD-binding subunit